MEVPIRINGTSHFKGCLVIFFIVLQILIELSFQLSKVKIVLKVFQTYTSLTHLSQMDYPTLINCFTCTGVK